MMGFNDNKRKSDVSNVYDIKTKKARKKVVTPEARKKRRRIIRVSLLFGGCIAVIGLLFVLIAQLFFNVSTINVEYTNKAKDRERYYTNKEIAANSTINEGDGMLFISSHKVAEAVEKNLPYISHVTVKKDLPSGIIIEVTECEKVYCFNSDKGCFFVDENGKFLEKTNNDSVKKYTSVKCKEISADVIGEKITLGDNTDEIFSYLELVRKTGLNITMLDFTDIDDVHMNYDNRISIHIGKMADEKNGVTAWKKLQLAKKSLEAEDDVNPEQKGHLNMTIKDKAYFRPESELPEEETD